MNKESDIFTSTTEEKPSHLEKISFGAKREKFMVDIRRQKRESTINRKRFMTKLDFMTEYNNDPYDYLRKEPEGDKIIQLINKTVNEEVKLEDLNRCVELIRSGNRLEKIVAIIKLRLILSIQEDTPIQAVIDTNIATELLRIIKEREEEYLRIEATWCLTNLATGTNLQVQSLVDKGIIPVFSSILVEDNINLIEQVIWGIGNLAGDCTEFRDELLMNNAMKNFATLYERVKRNAKRAFIKQLVWASSNLSRLKPIPEIPLIAPGIGIFCENLKIAIMNANEDEEEIQVIIDSLWALSQICNPFTVKAIAKHNILPFVLEVLKSDQIVVVHPCLRIVGAYSNAEDDLAQQIIDNDGISKLGKHLKNENKNIRKETTWILSNIAAGNSSQIQELFNCREVVELLFTISMNDHVDVSREAVWAICNTTKNMSNSQLQFLLQENVLEMFKNLLGLEQDSKVVNIILEAIIEIIEKSFDIHCGGNKNDVDNPLLIAMEDIGLVQKIDELQRHPSESVYKKAGKILSDYWDVDDEDW